MHTNFDKNAKGINYEIAQGLQLKNCQYFDQEKLAIISYKNNYDFLTFIKQIKAYFNFKKVVFFENQKVKTINNIVIAAGAGGSFVELMKSNNKKTTIDLFITGEMKWNHCIEAIDKKINVLIIGHQMEEKFIDVLKNFFLSLKSTKTIKIITYYYPQPQFL